VKNHGIEEESDQEAEESRASATRQATYIK
jgi:hypothetical protein